jgi:hypothetical protein
VKTATGVVPTVGGSDGEEGGYYDDGEVYVVWATSTNPWKYCYVVVVKEGNVI